MAAGMETQRLISVSLGKIAQSRGQRGGINLHKNLLVATVLHKARTAYMIEYNNYQQSIHRQRLLEQQQSKASAPSLEVVVDSSASGSDPNKGDHCPVYRDSNIGHHASTPISDEQTGSDISPTSGSEAGAHELMLVQESACDKENSPPSEGHALIIVSSTQSVDHLSAATQLSHEAALSSSDRACEKQQTLNTGTPTCNILKRRRDNPNVTSPHEQDCPVNKMAKLSQDSTNSHSSNSEISYTHSNGHSTEILTDSELESSDSVQTESHQISNLVNIFNAGFSGLCASDLNTSGFQCSLDLSTSQSFTRKIMTKAG